MIRNDYNSIEKYLMCFGNEKKLDGELKMILAKRSKSCEVQSQKELVWEEVKANMRFFSKKFIFDEFNDEEIYNILDLETYVHKYLMYLGKTVFDLIQILNQTKLGMWSYFDTE